MSYYLGIFGCQGPNPAAAILQDGEIIAFAEEERFNRIKMAPSAAPISAIDFCMKAAGIDFSSVAGIGFGWDCDRYVRELPDFFRAMAKTYPVDNNYVNELHEAHLRNGFDPERIKSILTISLAKLNYAFPVDKLKFYPHHKCHAASTFFASGYEQAVVLTLDGSGEEYATIVWHAGPEGLTKLKEFKLPHTLGGVYGTFTEYLGFKSDQDEGKLMGLAAYGSYSQEIQDKIEQILSYDSASGDYQVNPYMRFLGKRSFGQRFTDEFCSVFGPPRRRDEALTEYHKSIAFNLQWRLEQIVCALVRGAVKETGITKICMAGGVAMNCKMNGEIGMMDVVSDLYVQPASADNGAALGAAYLAASEAGVKRFTPMRHAYFGPAYSDAEVEKALIESKLRYRKVSNLEEEVAQMLVNGLIIGWVQGPMEVGARALGGRSILANPLIKEMREKLNLEVKHRENWRPFCPSLPIEAYQKYFGSHKVSEFMIMAYPVEQPFRAAIPAAVHVDGTARPQAVRKEHNPKFHKLLNEFGKLSGHPILINTSFNIQGEPVVMSPSHALRCYGGTGIDVLVMNNFIAEKAK